MQTEKKSRKFNPLTLILIGVGVLLCACVGVFASYNIVPQANQALKDASAAMIDLQELRQKTSSTYGISHENIGLKITWSSYSSLSGGASHQSQILNITPQNTSFNELSKSDMAAKMKEIASFLKANYTGDVPIDQYCVTLSSYTSFFIFSSTSSQSDRYVAGNL